MKERPILFSAPMVRAILEGRKTQTRRLVKGKALDWIENSGFHHDFVADPDNKLCPYGKVGDRLWVRETWAAQLAFNNDKPREIGHSGVRYFADNKGQANGKKRPAIFMPRWASRIILGITSLRIERLQDISDDDCIAEGIEELDIILGVSCFGGHHVEHTGVRYYFDGEKCPDDGYETAYDAFKDLWVSINGQESWDANPWVWVVGFKRVEQ